MTNLEILSPNCIRASYVPSRVPTFAGNPLIEALRAQFDIDSVLRMCNVRTGFDAAQRERPVEERLQMLKSLERFMIPLERHVALAMELDSMLFNGYVGRAPTSPHHIERLRQLHDGALRQEASLCLVEELRSTQQAKLLIGLSGMGKTRFVRRWASTFPAVIYHEALNLYQIPTLHIELPSNGASVAGLCNAILREVDRLIPGAQYLETYALKGRPSAETLIQRTAIVLHRHCVGMLLCDEVQNLTNVGKGKKTVMTEIVSMSNVLNLPILFIGTNKAQDIFALEFRTSRRVCGLGAEVWGNLDEGQIGDDGRLVSEWRDFAEVLMSNQWVRNPVTPTEEMLLTLHHCSAGIIDVAIKVFADAQARAMLDGTEMITPELLLSAYEQDFRPLHHMIGALRRDDISALASFDDIAPIGVAQLVSDLHRRARTKASRAYSVTPATPAFVPQVAAALTAAGVDENVAVHVAASIADEGKARNLLEATQQGIDKLTPSPKVARRKGKQMGDVAPQPIDLSGRPQDLRNATQNAQKSGRTVLEELRILDMVKPFDETLLVD